MFTYSVTWLKDNGDVKSIDSDRMYTNYDHCYEEAIYFLKEHNIKIGRLFILKNHWKLDEIMINL